jgi:hypothetical protein
MSSSRQAALQRGPIPGTSIGRGLIGVLQERQQSFVRIARGPDGVVGQKEFAKRFVIERLLRLDGVVAEAIGRRVSVGIEGWRLIPGPPGQKPPLLTSCEYASRVTESATLGAPGCGGAGRPENRVTARSKLPQKKCTGLTFPR